jgi:hypothetical protein
MKKALTVATVLCSITVPCFAQSFDPDVGSGNIVPFATNQGGGASAYAMEPGNYESNYSRGKASRRAHHPVNRAVRIPRMIDREDSND